MPLFCSFIHVFSSKQYIHTSVHSSSFVGASLHSSSLPVSSLGETSLGCRVGIRTRALLTSEPKLYHMKSMYGIVDFAKSIMQCC